MHIKSDVPSIVKSEPTKHGSDFDDVTLVYSDKKQISVHKVILLTDSPDSNKKKKECNSPEKLDVTLAFEDDKKVYAHSTILSSSSFCFAIEKKETSNLTLVYEDILQRNKLNTEWWFSRVEPKVFQYGGEGNSSLDEWLQQDPWAPPPNSCPPWPPQQEKHGHHSRGQVQGECYYERGGDN